MTPAEEKEALAALESVKPGAAASAVGRGWDETFAGDVTFLLPGGWTAIVFNDCADWDYIDTLIAPDGRRWQYPLDDRDKPWLTDALVDWRPSDEGLEAWGLRKSVHGGVEGA